MVVLGPLFWDRLLTVPARSGAGVRAVLFDLDGTLIESRPAIAASLNHTLRELGHPEVSEAEVAARIGWGLDHLLGESLPADDVARGHRLYSAHYQRTAVAASACLPGAPEVLEELRRRGVKTGVVTNKPARFTASLLAGLGLAPRLDVVVGAGGGLRRKPAPDMLCFALAAIGVEPRQSIYVGDMPLDGATAAASGARFVAVATGVASAAALRKTGAERVLNRLDELLHRPGPGSDELC